MADKGKEKKRKTAIEFPRSCEYGCGKYFNKAGNNESNYNKHLNHCDKKHKKVKSNLFKFFKREGNPSVTDATTQPDVVTNDGDETTHLDVVTNDDERIDDNEDLEQDVIAVCFEGASSIEKKVKLCKGFIIQYNNYQESFYRIYPFHRHSSEDPSLQLKHHISISYDEVSHNETLVIHSSSCTRALDDPTTESTKCCLDIEHSQQFKKILEMSSGKHTS